MRVHRMLIVIVPQRRYREPLRTDPPLTCKLQFSGPGKILLPCFSGESDDLVLLLGKVLESDDLFLFAFFGDPAKILLF